MSNIKDTNREYEWKERADMIFNALFSDCKPATEEEKREKYSYDFFPCIPENRRKRNWREDEDA